MNCFEISKILSTVQGLDRDYMAHVLKSLHNFAVLPTWRPGETGAELSPREIVMILLAATVARPGDPVSHLRAVSGLTREDGATLAAVLVDTLNAQDDYVLLDRIDVDPNSDAARITYLDGSFDAFGAPQDSFPGEHDLRGDLLAAIATKISVRNDLKNIMASTGC